jgi:hypothetical protein
MYVSIKLVIKYIYITFIGVLLATFIGVGIAAFYKSPTPPVYPAKLMHVPYPEGTMSAQLIEDQEKFNLIQQDFQKKSEEYNRNVSIISVIASIIILALSLAVLKDLMADGFLLGGLLTLIYSIIRGFSSQDENLALKMRSIDLEWLALG